MNISTTGRNSYSDSPISDSLTRAMPCGVSDTLFGFLGYKDVAVLCSTNRQWAAKNSKAERAEIYGSMVAFIRVQELLHQLPFKDEEYKKIIKLQTSRIICGFPSKSIHAFTLNLHEGSFVMKNRLLQQAVQDMPNLKNLTINGTLRMDELPRMEDYDVCYHNSFSYIATFSQLESLTYTTIPRNAPYDYLFSELNLLPCLKSLDLSNCRILNSHLRPFPVNVNVSYGIGKLKALEELTLSGCASLTDACLFEISQVPCLKTLTADGCSMSPEALSELQNTLKEKRK